MRNTQTPVGRQDVKICALCGALNHNGNTECWTCRWHGEFSRDERTISLAWQRLELRYEAVRLEHVTSLKLLALGDFGSALPVRGWRAAAARLRGWGDTLLARLARRRAAPRLAPPTPPGRLGV